MSKPKKLTIHDFLFKPLLYALLAQLFLILLFSLCYEERAPLNRYIDCEQATITVEEKYTTSEPVRRGFKTGFYISYNGDVYYFSNVNYSNTEFDEMIKVGERIDVYYIESFNIWQGKMFEIVSAEGDDTYVNFDDYNDMTEKSNTRVIIAFSILEALFIFFTVCLIPSWEVKDFVKNLKRKIKKIKKQKSA